MSEEGNGGTVKAWVHLLLILVGLLSIVAGLSPFVPSLIQQAPKEVADAAEAIEAEDVVQNVGFLIGRGQAPHNLVYGLFALIAGFALFRRRSWAWGMAIVILSVVVLTTVVDVFWDIFLKYYRGVPMGLDLSSVAWWAQMIAGLGAIVAWPTLVANRKVYNQ